MNSTEVTAPLAKIVEKLELSQHMVHRGRASPLTAFPGGKRNGVSLLFTVGELGGGGQGVSKGTMSGVVGRNGDWK